MAVAVRVVVESALLQLDREFDFLVPKELEAEIAFGQRVSFTLGRAKSELTGFVTEVLSSSKYATTYLRAIVSKAPVLRQDILLFARQVADRQCVAIGEILALAIPDHMPRVPTSFVEVAQEKKLGLIERRAMLSGKQEEVNGALYPIWMRKFLELAEKHRKAGFSSILLVPEASDVDWMRALGETIGVSVNIWETKQKSERYKLFHTLLGQVEIVIGTRSAIFAPVANLGFIGIADDLDESFRDQGSPHTHARDLALLRAGERSSIMFAAPYRSVEVQRLVEIGYLKEVEVDQALPRISFSSPTERVDETSFKLAKEALLTGTLLVLLPRKGVSSAAYCSSCGERLRCQCGGYIWEPSDGTFACRICGRPAIACQACRATSIRRGRSGSSRTAAEIGKMFPGAAIYEATGSKKPAVEERVNQIVIATAGSAPRLGKGYSGLIVLDSDVWLSAQSLRAEQFAIRDWTEAFELLSRKARIHFSGLEEKLGRPIALGQHRELARTAYLEAKKLKLPPAVRVVYVSGSGTTISRLVHALEGVGAKSLKQGGGDALLSFEYKLGTAVSKEIRSAALMAKSVRRGERNVRGLTVIMDELNV